MPHPVFTAHIKHMDALRAERLLDAATAATAQFQKAEWWDRLVARARGMAAEIAARVGPMFTWNGSPVNSSAGLRRKFADGVNARVES